ncbi:hypothetical protein [Weissella cibaria]|uniref:Uncharacterized protein n=1 Tax=Weissella cibaria TaxID=137591 RepID=A0A2S1KQ53_9LACO|nr:hypothetical protein [Weissella cibaria]AWF95126.1 hypothetical protein B6254_0716 [Weissella cibaria]
MAIAGVEPEYDMRALVEHAPAYVPQGFALYPEEQVREILINFANSKNAMRRDMTAEQIVDYFMERGE